MYFKFILVKSKYFVKLNGRIIRGNSVIEAISANTLVLINKKQVYYNFLIPDECHIQTKEDIINKINQLNDDNNLYLKLLNRSKRFITKINAATLPPEISILMS